MIDSHSIRFTNDDYLKDIQHFHSRLCELCDECGDVSKLSIFAYSYSKFNFICKNLCEFSFVSKPAFQWMYIMQISLRSILHDNIEMSLIREKLMQFDDIGMINFTRRTTSEQAYLVLCF